MSRITVGIVLLLSSMFMGCQSVQEGLVLKEQKNSLEDMRVAINNTTKELVPSGKFRFVRKDGREFITQYFSKKSQEEGFNPQTSKERLYAHFIIWGDRRPFDIQIRVFLERKTPNGYELYGEDVGREKEIGEMLSTQLKSLGKRNAIDDFRPF